MRQIPPALQAALDAGATTLCAAWIVTRADGVTLGFTDHDEDLVVAGTLCRARSAYGASEAEQSLGLAVDGGEVSGALVEDGLTEADLSRGRYDGATVEIHLVDWSAPENHVRLRTASIGEVRRAGRAFTAELRGLAHRFAEMRGRLYQGPCDADLGDARCRVDLEAPGRAASGTVIAAEDAVTLVVAGLDAIEPGHLARGRLRFTTGANAGDAVEIKDHRVAEGETRLALWQPMAAETAPGDAFTVTVGCDKQFATCRDRFLNAVNFRGFPHIPGTDFVTAYARPGGQYDGSVLEHP